VGVAALATIVLGGGVEVAALATNCPLRCGCCGARYQLPSKEVWVLRRSLDSVENQLFVKFLLSQP
jgi:hypothetical protein